MGAGCAFFTPIFTTCAVLAIRSYAMMRTSKSLERAFAAMLPCFEGNESDQNWTQRQQSIDELRKLTKSNTPKEVPAVYIAGIKLLLDGIIKAAESLRTTLSANGCKLIQDIAVAIGPSLDAAMLEKLLPAMISLCGHTKSLNKKNGDETVTAIVGNVPVTYRILQHISASSNDKNFSTRMCTAGWLKIIIEKNGRHCEQHGGLDLIDQCIRTGLQDAKLDVREPMRDTYWTFARIWPDRAESIMSSLDAKAQKTLEQHPNKLHSIAQPEVKPTKTQTTSKTTVAGPAKPSIKEIKLAAMRARKAATETSTTENDDDDLQTNSAVGGVPAQILLKEAPLSAAATTAPAIAPVIAPTAAPTTVSKTANAPSTTTQGGPRSAFTVTVGTNRNPTSHPILSSSVPKRAFLSSAPVRRPRRPETPTESAATKNGTSATIQQTTRTDHPSGHLVTTERGNFSVAPPTGHAAPTVEQTVPTVGQPPTKPGISTITHHAIRSDHPSAYSITAERGRPRVALQRSSPEILHDNIPFRPEAPVLELSGSLTVDQTAPQQPSHDLVATQATIVVDSSPVEPLSPGTVPAPMTPTSTVPIVSGQENDKDTITHKHTWSNKELAERRRSISPRSKDPEEARKLLAKGIDRIKSRSIDDHGYRKLQGLINYHDDIFQEKQKYDEMLLALLNALETPNTERRAPLGRRFDNKFQILVTVRLMFIHNRKYFAAYFPRAMSALLIARRNFESRNHIVSGLEEIAQDITAACNPLDVVDAVMDVLETEERDERGNRTVAMGLHILSGLSARMRALKTPLEPQQENRMAKLALTCLREPTSIVRRAVIEYCLELKRVITPEARFFRLVTGDGEDLKNLITYYAANSAK